MTKSRKIFITGTDTEVGKTFFTAALIRALQAAGKSVVGLKPVAAGSEKKDGQWKNEDALALIDSMAESHEYEKINPIALQSAIAPHIAAKEEGIELSVKVLQRVLPLANFAQEYQLIEGAGGWLVPLNHHETLADYVKAEACDVILVVGLKLGCINHALLTQSVIKSQGLNLIGWVANHIDPKMKNQADNIETLESALDCPLIAQIPYLDAENDLLSAGRYVKLERLI